MALALAGPGRPGFLRSMNDRAALGLLISQGPMTRAQIGEATGLSGPTTSQLIARLSQAGLVDEAGRVARSHGPSAVVYRACTETSCGVAAHVLPDHIAARLVDPAGEPYPVVEVRLPAKGRSGVHDLGVAIDAACAAAGRQRDRVVAICVGVPGAVVPGSDELHFVGPLRGWPRHAVRAQLEEHLGGSVLIENDANLAAVAEARVRPGEDDFALLWQGEGLAVASVTDGRVHRGASGGAGEIGYVPTPQAAAAIDPQAADMQALAGAAAVTRLDRQHRPSTRTF
ncbi:MAG: ROK family transcriptional regulator, partial [Micrococcales bacterium]|nr:ROK family transcriptional regulator [Micrococcales bacterium]